MDRETQEIIEEAFNAQKPMVESIFEDVDIDDVIDAAEEGDEDMQAMVGIAYLYGIQVRRNYDKAAKWLEKSARQGVAVAEYHLGLCYTAGMGVEQDLDEAIRWVRRSAKHGCADAVPFLIFLEAFYDLETI